MLPQDLQLFLEDITYYGKYEFLEESKHKDELTEIASRKGIQLPAHDLAPFKCVYAYVDRFNLNGCRLPKEEVEKALSTLNSKAINFDHMRQRVVGHWIHAKIVKDQIIAYGIFYKGNFPEDYVTVKNLMEKDVLAISFESWGNRKFVNMERTKYDLVDIELSGGALLIKTKPAFPGSEVIEMAKRNNDTKVLEFASIMTEPKKYIHEIDGEQILEISRFYVYDIQNIMRMVSEVDCLTCKEKGYSEIDIIDFKENKAKITCLNCKAEMGLDLTPHAMLTKKGRQIKKISTISKSNIDNYIKYIEEFEGSDESLALEIESIFEESENLKYEQRQKLTDDLFALVKSVKIKTGKEKKIRMFPIEDEAHIRSALAKLAQDKVKETLNQLGVSVDSVKEKILRRAKKLNMKKLLEKYSKATIEEVVQEIAKAKIKRELSEEEMKIAKAKIDEKGEDIKEEDLEIVMSELVKASEKTVAEKATTKEIEDAKILIKAKEDEIQKLQTELEASKVKMTELEKKLEDIEKAERQKKIDTRKSELAEFAKDMKDEDILDDIKYENAKLKKEVAELKASKGSEEHKDTDNKDKKDLTKGSTDKGGDVELRKRQAEVDKYAWKDNKEV